MMPWTRPSRAQLIQESQLDLQSRLPGADSQLPRSATIAIATVLGEALDAVYGRVQQIAADILPDTSEKSVLIRQANLRGLSQELATPAAGNVIFTGNDTAPIPAGTIVQRSDGAQFTTNASASISGTSVTVPVTASLAGGAGNTQGNAALTLGSTVANVSGTATVDTNGLTGGADIESIDSLRARVEEFDRQEAVGGNLSDYVKWAKQIPGVTRAWAYKKWMGPGTVGLTFVLDNNPSSIIPASGDVTSMQTWIDSVAPGVATNVVFAPTPVAMNPSLHLIGADTPVIRAAVVTELQALISGSVQADGTLGVEPGGTTFLNQVIGAINAAAGVVNFSINSLAGVAPADLVMPPGSLLVLGTPVFT